MTLRLNGSTSGYVEIDAPAVAGTSVLMLPSGTGVLAKETGAWTVYAPTLGNWSVGNGTLEGTYTQIGKTIIGRAVFTAGSTSTFTSYPTVTFPVTAKFLTTQDAMQISGYAFDSSTGSRYPLLSTNANTFSVPLAGVGPMTTLSSTIPFAWATGDKISLTFTYEAA